MDRRRFLRLLGLGVPAVAAPAWASAYELSPWPAREKMPSLDRPDMDGNHWRLSELRGRAVLLNFWASWCEPCRAEMPTLQQLAEIYGPDQLVVLAINFKEPARKAALFAKTTGLNLPVLLDPTGQTARQWGVRVFPTTILIGADGGARQRIRGEVDWTSQEAQALVSALMTPEPRR